MADETLAVAVSSRGGLTVPTNAAVAASKQVAAEQRKIVGELREQAVTAEREAQGRERAERAERDQRDAERTLAAQDDGAAPRAVAGGGAAPDPATGRATVLDIVA